MDDLDDQLRQQSKLGRQVDTLTDDQCHRRDWSGIADHDVLRLIARDHLPAAVDRIAASIVCKSWRRAILSVHDGDDDRRLRSYGLPCLVYVHARESAGSAPSCRLIDPIHVDNKHTLEDVAGLAGAAASTPKIVFSRDGWLLLMSPPRTRTNQDEENTMYCDMFFLNLLSKSNIKLPTLKTGITSGQFSFSDRPTSPSCVVVAFLSLAFFDMCIGFCRPGDAQWTMVEAESDIPFLGCLTNVVWSSSGRFYCLDTRGNLGAFDPNQQSWTFVARQEDLGRGVNGQLEQYLVESAGDLLRVCEVMGSSVVVVYRFDEPTERWVPVKDLGDRALFVGRQNSMSVVAPVESSMRGKVYFNAVTEDDHVVVSCSIDDDQSEEYCVEKAANIKGCHNNKVRVPPPAGASGGWKKFMFSAWVDLEY